MKEEKGSFSLDIDKLTKRVSGKCVARLTVPHDGRLEIHFVDGSSLLIERLANGLAIDFASNDNSRDCGNAAEPTVRQSEYLAFIKKYMDRFGFSPAESDIQRHFLVSAPSVNQMMQSLERLGFITRQRGMGRSIRLVEASKCTTCGSTHYVKNPDPRGLSGG